MLINGLIWNVFVLKHALCALRQGLGFQETLSKAPFESVLLSIRYVLILQQAVQAFDFKPLVTCQETLRDKVRLTSRIHTAGVLLHFYHT